MYFEGQEKAKTYILGKYKKDKIAVFNVYFMYIMRIFNRMAHLISTKNYVNLGVI